jgi:hypothetical protein
MFLGFMNDKYNKNFDSLPGGSTMKLVYEKNSHGSPRRTFLICLFAKCNFWLAGKEAKDYPAEVCKDLCCQLMKGVAEHLKKRGFEAVKKGFCREKRFGTDNIENEDEAEDNDENSQRTVITIH